VKGSRHPRDLESGIKKKKKPPRKKGGYKKSLFWRKDGELKIGSLGAAVHFSKDGRAEKKSRGGGNKGVKEQ